MENKFLTNREWILIIILIVVIQFTVQVAAWSYSTDANLLNYISFTGTIVSIILALLAIIYSFVQTFSRENSSQRIGLQIDNLVEVVKNIQTSEDDLGKVLETLTVINQKVEQSTLKQRKLETSIVEIGNKLSSIQTDFSSKANNEYRQQISPEKEDQNLTRKLILDSSNGVVISMLIIYYSYLKKISINTMLQDYIIEIVNILKVDNDSPDTLENLSTLIKETLFTCVSIFSVLEFIKTKELNKPFAISPEFEEEVRSFSKFMRDEYQETEDPMYIVNLSLYNSISD